MPVEQLGDDQKNKDIVRLASSNRRPAAALPLLLRGGSSSRLVQAVLVRGQLCTGPLMGIEPAATPTLPPPPRYLAGVKPGPPRRGCERRWQAKGSPLRELCGTLLGLDSHNFFKKKN